MSSRVLKDAFLAVPQVLLEIIRLSINKGIFPTAWKRGTVIPIPKVTNPVSPSELRPVALLPLPGKIIERVVGNQTEHYLEGNSLLTPSQSGFRKGKSTISTVCSLTDDIYKGTHTGHLTSAVFIDFKKAFDCVDHNILCSKLANFGFSPSTIKWFRSYLKDRQQRTFANGTKSKFQKVRCGVPQGSILGPILFLAFVNDLPDILGHTRYKLYADDTLIYSTGPTYELMAIALNKDLEALTIWCKQNLMYINYSKTKLLTFGSAKALASEPATTKVKIDGNEIQSVRSYKYLGVILDPQLTFEEHVSKCLRNASYKLSILRKVRPLLNKGAALQVYKAIILPLVE